MGGWVKGTVPLHPSPLILHLDPTLSDPSDERFTARSFRKAGCQRWHPHIGHSKESLNIQTWHKTPAQCWTSVDDVGLTLSRRLLLASLLSRGHTCWPDRANPRGHQRESTVNRAAIKNYVSSDGRKMKTTARTGGQICGPAQSWPAWWEVIFPIKPLCFWFKQISDQLRRHWNPQNNLWKKLS